ncbi:hypothetical protein PUN28_013773 [Cardiocondyla obscurior]|uniref:Uncharacterized protein n=1 Tax=Cardiocondyla obscurior TaxID=286306 RepID=A0AAW2F758_9HYME
MLSVQFPHSLTVLCKEYVYIVFTLRQCTYRRHSEMTDTTKCARVVVHSVDSISRVHRFRLHRSNSRKNTRINRSLNEMIYIEEAIIHTILRSFRTKEPRR